MRDADSAFAGSVPEHYDRLLGPMLFEPQARSLAHRYVGFEGDLLETAAGTGRLTRALVAVIADGARIIASDLNAAMIAHAAAGIVDPRIAWREADAQALPFADAAFDAVVCQFGMMFFPDKAAGYAEARRVLRPGGLFRFTVWDAIETNDFMRIASAALERAFPDDPPGFFARGPCGYHDRAEIGRALDVAGFEGVAFETVQVPTPAASAEDAAAGLCRGSPLAAEIEAGNSGDVPRAITAIAAALRDAFGSGPIIGQGQSLLVTARRADLR